MARARLAGVTDEELRRGMESFRGVERRFDFKLKSEAKVYLSDYAHHPAEIRPKIVLRTRYNNLIMIFGKKIKELREERGLLQRQLSAALEIDTPMYSKIEHGERKAKRSQIPIMAKLFDVEEK